MTRKFKFKTKTVQMPWTPECREFFGLRPDEASPAFYSVTIRVKTLLFVARAREGGWTATHYRECANPLNLSILRGAAQ